MTDDGSRDYFPVFDEPSMEIIVETLTGATFEMTVSADDTVGSIKNKIQRVEGMYCLFFLLNIHIAKNNRFSLLFCIVLRNFYFSTWLLLLQQLLNAQPQFCKHYPNN